MKDAIRSFVILSGVCLFAACGQAPPEANTDLESAAESDALRGVKNCLSAGQACKADAATAADVAACQQQVRACFAGLVPDGGAGHDCDGGFPRGGDRDAQGPGVVVPDAGRRAAIEGCLTSLRDCLAAGTDPMTCGRDARTCLETALHP